MSTRPSQTDAVLTATANDIARANGISTGSVSVARLSNYSSSVSDAAKVAITLPYKPFAGLLYSGAMTICASSCFPSIT